MGLDITWYRGIARAAESEGRDEDGLPLDGFNSFYLNSDFPGRADDITEGAIYSFEEEGDFCAGSYGGYNRWRDDLAKLAGYAATPHARYGSTETRHDAGAWQASSGPFWELINFSDCEGTIGTAVSAKLSADFAKYQPKADSHPNEYFRERYARWRNAFDKAAQSGCVAFH